MISIRHWDGSPHRASGVSALDPQSPSRCRRARNHPNHAPSLESIIAFPRCGLVSLESIMAFPRRPQCQCQHMLLLLPITRPSVILCFVLWARRQPWPWPVPSLHHVTRGQGCGHQHSSALHGAERSSSLPGTVCGRRTSISWHLDLCGDWCARGGGSQEGTVPLTSLPIPGQIRGFVP